MSLRYDTIKGKPSERIGLIWTIIVQFTWFTLIFIEMIKLANKPTKNGKVMGMENQKNVSSIYNFNKHIIPSDGEAPHSPSQGYLQEPIRPF